MFQSHMSSQPHSFASSVRPSGLLQGPDLAAVGLEKLKKTAGVHNFVSLIALC